MQLETEQFKFRESKKKFRKIKGSHIKLVIALMTLIIGIFTYYYNVFNVIKPSEAIEFLNNYEKVYVEFMNTKDIKPLMKYVEKYSKAYYTLIEYAEDLKKNNNKIYTGIHFKNETEYKNNSIIINEVVFDFIENGKQHSDPQEMYKVFYLRRRWLFGKWKLYDTVTREYVTGS